MDHEFSRFCFLEDPELSGRRLSSPPKSPSPAGGFQVIQEVIAGCGFFYCILCLFTRGGSHAEVLLTNALVVGEGVYAD